MSDEMQRQDLIRAHRRNLAILEQQKATYGNALVPPHIVTQIEDLRKQLADLEMLSASNSAPSGSRGNISLAPADPFVGRAPELAELASLLEHSACVAIHGLGGMGKTALALAAGRAQHELGVWTDGVWLVELRNITSAAQARAQIAAILGLEPKAAGDDMALAAPLRGWRALLILDDLDVLLQNDRAGVAALLRRLLGCAELRRLLTARHDLPGPVSHERLPLTRLDAADAEAAFRHYAPPPARWGQWQPADLAALLAFLDGYPFPIRLAGTYMRQARCDLPAQLARLRANPRGTLRYPGDAEDRETSLAATLDLSYQALPDDAKQVLPLLALFPAGLTREAAWGILGDWSEPALEALLQYAMAEERDAAGYIRFALPEPARSYAAALQPEGAMEQYMPAALAYFADFIERQDELFVAGKYEECCLNLTLEQSNYHHVLDWSYTNEQRSRNTSLGAQATGRLRNYWMLTFAFQHRDTLDRLQRAAIAAQACGDDWSEANVRKAIGDIQQFRDEQEAALESFAAALELYRAVGSKLGEANVLRSIGDVQRFRGDQEAALASLQSALELYRTLGERLGEANVLGGQARIALQQGNETQAQQLHAQSLDIYRAIGDRYSIARTIAIYGSTLHDIGQQEEAYTYFRKAADLFAEIGMEVWAQQYRRRAQEDIE